MPGNGAAAKFETFYYMFMCVSLRCNNVNYCGYRRGPIWVHVRADMGSREQAVMGLVSQAVSARVTKHFVTIFSNACYNP